MGQAELAQILDVIRKAASAVRELGDSKDFEMSLKENQARNYLTEADIEANRILKQLLTIFPDSAWLSEEDESRPEPMQDEWLWIIDPVDGTREFVEGLAQCSVSVALCHRNQIRFAAVCNPWDALFYTCGSEVIEETLGDRRIAANEPVCGSRSENDDGLFERLSGLKVQPVGSIAYKLALVAAGHFKGVLSLKPKNEWDVAAGVALVEASGRRAVDILGRRFRFNQGQRLCGVVAGDDLLVRDLLADYDLCDAFAAASPKAAQELF